MNKTSPEYGAHLREQIRLYLVDHPEATGTKVGKVVKCSQATAARHIKALRDSGEVSAVTTNKQEEAVSKENDDEGGAPPKQAKLKERIEELEGQVAAYEARLSEVQEALVDQVIECNRLRRLAQEAEAAA